CAASLVIAIGLQEGARFEKIPGADAVVCTNEAPIVCTRAPFEAGLEDFGALMVEAYELLPSDLQPDAVVTDSGIAERLTGTVRVFQPTGGDAAPTNLIDHDSTLAALGTELFVTPCAETNLRVSAALDLWWRLEWDIPIGDGVRPGDFVAAHVLPPAQYEEALSRAQALERLDPADLRGWLSENSRALVECRVEGTDFP